MNHGRRFHTMSFGAMRCPNTYPDTGLVVGIQGPSNLSGRRAFEAIFIRKYTSRTKGVCAFACLGSSGNRATYTSVVMPKVYGLLEEVPV